MNEPLLGGALLARLYEPSGASAWDLTPDQFRAALEASVARAFERAAPAPADVERFTSTLHLQDLALAAACAAGSARAWDHFVARYRPVLARAADATDPTGAARELADAMFGELYGLELKAGTRQSLFRYFHGRSSLATWLRAVLAQRLIDAKRAGRRTEPLPDEDASRDRAIGVGTPPADPETARLAGWLAAALKAALDALPARDRLRLACYYAGGQKLAAIGRQLGEHEATVSRHLARTRQEIREGVNRRLREDRGLDDAAVELCWRSVLADSSDLDIEAIMTGSRKDPVPARSKEQEGV